MKTARHGPLPRVSAGVLRVFTAYTRRYLRRRFHAFRILRSGLPPRELTRPIVVFLNHSAWWDPLVSLLVAREFFADRRSFAPIDAAMLERYGFFKRLGFFGVEQGSARGGMAFLRTAEKILSTPGSALWLTPQGRFQDVRERPLRLRDGLGALAALAPQAVFIPLAIEYAFWTEPRPEILVSFGEPIVPEMEEARRTPEWTKTFATALEMTQDELAARSCRRDPAEWRMLARGASGVTGIYDTWRRLRARWRGEKFNAEHPAEVRR